MTRYTINIGDDFPLGEEPQATTGGPPGPDGGRRRFRGRLLLRILFVVAAIAIVVHHPVPVALLTGLALLIMRRRGGMHDGGAAWFESMKARFQNGAFGACNRPDCGRRGRGGRDHNRPEGGGGYGAFV